MAWKASDRANALTRTRCAAQYRRDGRVNRRRAAVQPSKRGGDNDPINGTVDGWPHQDEVHPDERGRQEQREYGQRKVEQRHVRRPPRRDRGDEQQRKQAEIALHEDRDRRARRLTGFAREQQRLHRVAPDDRGQEQVEEHSDEVEGHHPAVRHGERHRFEQNPPAPGGERLTRHIEQDTRRHELEPYCREPSKD